MGGLGSAGTFFPITYRKGIQPKTSSDETPGEPWRHWNISLVPKGPRVAQVSRTFPSIFWASLVLFQYISTFCLSLYKVVSITSNSKKILKTLIYILCQTFYQGLYRQADSSLVIPFSPQQPWCKALSPSFQLRICNSANSFISQRSEDSTDSHFFY